MPYDPNISQNPEDLKVDPSKVAETSAPVISSPNTISQNTNPNILINPDDNNVSHPETGSLNTLLIAPDHKLYSVPPWQLADALDPLKGNYKRLPDKIDDMAVSPDGIVVKLSPEEKAPALDPKDGGYIPLSQKIEDHTKIQELQSKIDDTTYRTETKRIIPDNTPVFGEEKVDGEKTVSLIGPNGSRYDAPRLDAIQLLASGDWKLADHAAQLAYQAHLQANNSALNNSWLERADRANFGSVAETFHPTKWDKDSNVNYVVRDLANGVSEAGISGSANVVGKGIAVAEKVLPAIAAAEIGGPLAEGAALSAGASEGTAGIIGAIGGGAAMALPEAIPKFIEGKHAQAAEDLALSAGLNFVLHGAFSAIKAGVSELTPEAKSALELKEVGAKDAAMKQITSKLGISASELEKAAPLLENGIKDGTVVSSVSKTIENLEKLETNNTKLLSALDQLDTLPNKGMLIGRELSKVIGEVSTSEPVVKELQKVVENPSFRGLQEAKNAISALGEKTISAETKDAAVKIISNSQKSLESTAVSQLEKIDKPALLKKIESARQLGELASMVKNYAKLPEAESMWKTVINSFKGHSSGYGLSAMAHLVGLPHVSGVLAGVNAATKTYKTLKAIIGASSDSGLAVNAYKSADELVLKAMERRNSAISKGIKSVFDSLGTDKIARTATLVGTKSLKDLLPDNGIGKNEKQQLITIRKNLSQATDVNQLTQNLAPVVDALNKAGLQSVAQSYTDHQVRLMKVLDAVLPKHDIMAASPFSQKVEADEISPAAKAKYERAVTLSLDPDRLLDMIKNNTISLFDVAIVSATNPETLQRMRQEIQEQAMGLKKVDMSLQQRLSMSIMLGTHLDECTQQVPALQSVYPAPPAPVSPGGGKGKKPSASKTEEMSKNYLSPTQRVIGGHS